MSINKTTGDRGEQIAAEYIIKNGFRVLERNYRYKRAEIDIIALKNEQLIFVEVKTRTGSFFGNPEEAVDEKKAEMIMMAANHYIFENSWDMDIRFDIISVLMNPNLKIYHFEDAFY